MIRRFSKFIQSQTTKIILTIIITAVVIGGGTYYILSTKGQSFPFSYINISKQENIVFNKSSKEYALLGMQIIGAFKCSAWASEIDDQKEAERLFIFGYERSKEFIGALGAQKIKQEDMRSEVPLLITMLLQGPSEDFIIGRIYSFVEDDALEDVFSTNGSYNSDEVQKIIANNKFRDGNCQFMGK